MPKLRMIEWGGQIRTLTGWARHLGLSAPTLHGRLAKLPIADALTSVPMKHGPPVKPIETRFWSKVQKGEGCWLWTAHTNGKYGTLITRERSQRHTYAHRLSWELHHGPIPDGMLVCHHCDTPLCVRPDHLFLGTQKDNLDDCARKGRRRGRFSKARPHLNFSHL